jgi:pimeloyl-ACP methyl ester carboxylesterase
VDPRAGTDPVVVDGEGIRFTGLSWQPTGSGPGTGRRAVLLHGVQSSAITMARTARAMAADGWRCIALDMSGHGTTHWLDGVDDEARYTRPHVNRLVGAAVAAVADRPALIGHSWGADTTLALAASGAHLGQAVLIDPPDMTSAELEALTVLEVADLRPHDLPAARMVIEAAGAIRDPLDIAAKAEALTHASALAITAALRDPGFGRPSVDARRWRALPGRPRLDLIAGEPAFGGLIPELALAELRGILGAEHVHLMSGAGHSPQRTDFERFWPLLRAILG